MRFLYKDVSIFSPQSAKKLGTPAKKPRLHQFIPHFSPLFRDGGEIGSAWLPEVGSSRLFVIYFQKNMNNQNMSVMAGRKSSASSDCLIVEELLFLDEAISKEKGSRQHLEILMLTARQCWRIFQATPMTWQQFYWSQNPNLAIANARKNSQLGEFLSQSRQYIPFLMLTTCQCWKLLQTKPMTFGNMFAGTHLQT